MNAPLAHPRAAASPFSRKAAPEADLADAEPIGSGPSGVEPAGIEPADNESAAIGAVEISSAETPVDLGLAENRVLVPSLPLTPAAEQRIEAWRGRCIDLFARGEWAMCEVLQSAVAVGGEAQIPAASVHQAAAVRALAGRNGTTAQEVQALDAMLTDWESFGSEREQLVHGTLTFIADHAGCWHARLGSMALIEGELTARHWMVTQDEAEVFEARLRSAFGRMSAQLGALRWRLRNRLR